MDNEEKKKKLLETNNLLLETKSEPQLHSKNEILLYSTFFKGTLDYNPIHMTQTNPGRTWVKLT